MSVSFKYEDRLSRYVLESEGGYRHETVTVGENAVPGRGEIIVDVYEPDPGRRRSLRRFLNSRIILGDLYMEEMYCETLAWNDRKGSKRSVGALFELYHGSVMSEGRMYKLAAAFKSVREQRRRSRVSGHRRVECETDQ